MSANNDLGPIPSITFGTSATLVNGRRRVLPQNNQKKNSSKEPLPTKVEKNALIDRTQENSERRIEEPKGAATQIYQDLPLNIICFLDNSRKATMLAPPLLPENVRLNPTCIKYREFAGVWLGKYVENMDSGSFDLWIDRFDSGMNAGDDMIPNPTYFMDKDVIVHDCNNNVNNSTICRIIDQYLSRKPLILDLFNPLMFFYSLNMKKVICYHPKLRIRLDHILPFSWTLYEESVMMNPFGFISVDSKRHVRVHSFKDPPNLKFAGIWIQDPESTDLLYKLCWYYKYCSSIQKFHLGDTCLVLKIESTQFSFHQASFISFEDPFDVYVGEGLDSITQVQLKLSTDNASDIGYWLNI